MLNSMGERTPPCETPVSQDVSIDVVWMHDFYMLCRICVPWCSLR